MSKTKTPFCGFSGASGRIGGLVLQPNKKACHVRQHTTPRDPQTTPQLSHRGLFQAFARYWNGLDSAAKAYYASLTKKKSTNRGYSDYLKIMLKEFRMFQLGQGITIAFMSSPHTVIQGTWNVVPSGSIPFGGFLINVTAALNDEFYVETFLPAGTYRFGQLTYNESASGIVSVFLNDVFQYEYDLYSATPTFYGSFDHEFTITTGRTVKFSFRMTGKNPSSAAYAMYGMGIFITRKA